MKFVSLLLILPTLLDIMTIQTDFEKWLTTCPVDYYQAFGNNTYMFLVPSETESETEEDTEDS